MTSPTSEPDCWGTVVWFTPEQGGRRSGPPRPVTPERGYAANGWLPPLDASSGLRSLVLVDFEPGAWRSAARAHWLVPSTDYPPVRPGSVLVVSEGPRAVAVLFVDGVEG